MPRLIVDAGDAAATRGIYSLGGKTGKKSTITIMTYDECLESGLGCNRRHLEGVAVRMIQDHTEIQRRAWHVVSASAQEPLLLGTQGEQVRVSEVAFLSKPRAGQRGSLPLPPAQARIQARSLLQGIRKSPAPNSRSGALSTPEQDFQAHPLMSHPLGPLTQLPVGGPSF